MKKLLSAASLLVLLVAVTGGCANNIDHREIIVIQKLSWMSDPHRAMYIIRINNDDFQFKADKDLFQVGDTLELVRRRNDN